MRLKSSVALRPYQEEIVCRVQSELRVHRSVMVQMPTGTGKTHVLSALVDAVARDGRPVVIVAHRRELVSQIERTLEGHPSLMAGRLSLIRVFSIQWLRLHYEDAEPSPSLVVIDEAHHALAGSYSELW